MSVLVRRTMMFAGVLAAALTVSCNDHVFRLVDVLCNTSLVADKDIPVEKAADILVVVDNSGSMCEEQQNLVDNFYNADCPIKDVNNIPPDLRNPSPEFFEPGGRLEKCGFIQILAAYDNDFRVGVITTDVGQCDNRLGNAADSPKCGFTLDGPWGNHPMRGCLQTPRNETRKVISRSDTDIVERFRGTLANIRIFGSSWERGLDAVEAFLSKEPDMASKRHPDCKNDVDKFLRTDAKLVVIFLSDEEDCSHRDGKYGFNDEEFDAAGNPTQCGSFTSSNYPESITRTAARVCYPVNTPDSEYGKLAPVADYVNFLRNVKGKGREKDVSVAVIAGGLRGQDGTVLASGCKADPKTGAPVRDSCEESQGLSGSVGQGERCYMKNCCEADPGTRYFQLAAAMGADQALTDSICYKSFRDTMIKIARFIASVDYVDLAEPPVDPDTVYVTLNGKIVPRLGSKAECGTGNGWVLEGDRRVQFCGNAIPGPGQSVRVRAQAKRGALNNCLLK